MPDDDFADPPPLADPTSAEVRLARALDELVKAVQLVEAVAMSIARELDRVHPERER